MTRNARRNKTLPRPTRLRVKGRRQPFAYIPAQARQPHPPTPGRIVTLPLYDPRPGRGRKLIGYFAPAGRLLYTAKMTASRPEVDNRQANAKYDYGQRMAIALGVHDSKIHQLRLEAISRQGL